MKQSTMPGPRPTVSKLITFAGGAIVAAAALLGPGSVARAQTAAALPPAIFNASSLNDDQRQQIDQYVTATIKQLGSDQRRAVAKARQSLVATLQNPNASDAFKTYYNQAVGDQLDPVIQSDQVLTRLNAAIVMGKLRDAGAAPLARRLLGDDNPAVRYWAAKAMRNIASAGHLTPDQQRQSLEALNRMVGAEASPRVLSQVLDAMLAIPGSQSRQTVLQALNQRLTFHAQNPRAPYTAEQATLGRLFRDMVTEQSNGGANPQDLRGLARLSVLYLQQAAHTLASSEGNRGDLTDGFTALMSLTGERVLPFAFSNLNMPAPQPASIRQPLYAKQWGDVERRALDWKQVMTNRAWTYAYPPDQLQLPGGGEG